jgi:hypothetical protein
MPRIITSGDRAVDKTDEAVTSARGKGIVMPYGRDVFSRPAFTYCNDADAARQAPHCTTDLTTSTARANRIATQRGEAAYRPGPRRE